jgi:hypothetical protein
MPISSYIDYIVFRLVVIRDYRVIQMKQKFDLTHLMAYLSFTGEMLGFPEGVNLIITRRQKTCVPTCAQVRFYVAMYICTGFRSGSYIVQDLESGVESFVMLEQFAK